MSRPVFEIHQYVLMIDSQKRLLWLKQAKNRQRWLFPGGTLEEGETLEQGLKRELREETGLKMEVVSLLEMALIPEKNPVHLALFFLAKPKKGMPKLSHEHLAFKWVREGEMGKKEAAHPELLKLEKKAFKMWKKSKQENLFRH